MNTKSTYLMTSYRLHFLNRLFSSLKLESVCLKLRKATFVMLHLADYKNCLIFPVAYCVS